MHVLLSPNAWFSPFIERTISTHWLARVIRLDDAIMYYSMLEKKNTLSPFC
jgi:hypothetical protein